MSEKISPEQAARAAEAITDCLNCDDDEAQQRLQRIYEYLDGALSYDDIREVRAHLEDCPQCASNYDLECVIRDTVRRCCTEQAPETLKVTILERISTIRTDSGH
ncbi:mycothiol system anti-sigma-R factor [Nesterenkonia populi]|uniref:mycothiol system anti-sigma-R factor n=1 Tax=Nesterenkonia populi TaxID=1591087 RepID=UPI0011BE0D46|nr:mycothiol system anti-sigma-R factor [Nesterenkonia populi]